MMSTKKTIGILRNKFQLFKQAKASSQKPKSRFKPSSKKKLEIRQSQFNRYQGAQINDQLLSTAFNSSSQNSQTENFKSCDMYEQAKLCLSEVESIMKKMSQETKIRLRTFKQSQVARIDKNIYNMSAEALQLLLKAQRAHQCLRKMKGSTKTQQNYYRNMQISLGIQLRQCSKNLRGQEKQFFQKIRNYEGGSANMAIELTSTQKNRMVEQNIFSDAQLSVQTLQMEQRNKNIQQLVASINALTQLYKKLNQLTIQQGSIVDRIDENIDGTLLRAQKANKQLEKANQHARSHCAQKCMIFLLVLIMIMAILIAIKPKWVKYLELAAIA